MSCLSFFIKCIFSNIYILMGFIFHAFAGNRKWKRNDILKHYYLAPFRKLHKTMIYSYWSQGYATLRTARTARSSAAFSFEFISLIYKTLKLKCRSHNHISKNTFEDISALRYRSTTCQHSRGQISSKCDTLT